MLRYVCIVGGLAGAFGLGYLLQGRLGSTPTNPTQTTANAELKPASTAEVAQPAGDPSLILPDRLPDADGAFTDPSFQAVKGHYMDLAKPLTPPSKEQPTPRTLSPGTHYGPWTGPTEEELELLEETKKHLPLPKLPFVPKEPSFAKPKKLPEEVSGPTLPPPPSVSADIKVEGPELPKKSAPEIVQVGAIQLPPKLEDNKPEPKIDVPPVPRLDEPFKSALPPIAIADEVPAPKHDPEHRPTEVKKAPVNVAPIPCLNTRSISVTFDVTKLGNSGIKATELWVRTPNQTEWQILDRKKGLVQPFATYLPGQGTYSVAVVLISGSGMSQLVPENALEVEVDMTLPTAKLLDLKPIVNCAEQVEISWKADDKNFDEKAIRLDYSWDGTDWLAITQEPIPNTGTYTWKLPEGMNHEVQLRLTAKDRAGNETEAFLPEKLSVDRVVPQGKVTGILKVEELPMPREPVKVFDSTVTPLTAIPSVPQSNKLERYPVHPTDERDLCAEWSYRLESKFNEGPFFFGGTLRIERPLKHSTEPLVDWVGLVRQSADLAIGKAKSKRWMPASIERFLSWCTGCTDWREHCFDHDEVDLSEFVIQDVYRLTPYPDKTSWQLAFLKAITMPRESNLLVQQFADDSHAEIMENVELPLPREVENRVPSEPEQLPMPREASAIPELAPVPREADNKSIFSFWLGFFH